MSIESKLDKLNALLGELIRTLQQDVNPVTPPAQQTQALPPMQQPPAQQMQAPPMQQPPAQQVQPPPTQQPPMQQPPMQQQPPADNVVQHPAAGGPALTREQLNTELMAVVTQLGGGPAAAEQVMNLMVSKYGTGSLQGLDESYYPALLADVKALVGG